MDKKQLILKIQRLIDTRLDLEEVIRFVNILEELFQKELKVIGTKIRFEIDKKRKAELVFEAEKLYEEYRKTINVLNDYINQYGLIIQPIK